MDNKTLKSSIKAYCLELMQEISALGGEGAYMTKFAGRKVTSKDKTSPTGFETSPKNNYYKKFKFRVVKPKERLNSKDLLKEIKINNPSKTFKPGQKVKTKDGKVFIVNRSFDNIVYVHIEDINSHEFLFDKKDLQIINESKYNQFKKQATQLKPKEILHRAIKEIQLKLDEVEPVQENKKEFIHRINKEIYQKLDEINNHIEYTSKIKGSEDKEINELNNLKNSLLKIKSKINEIKINKPNLPNIILDLFIKLGDKIDIGYFLTKHNIFNSGDDDLLYDLKNSSPKDLNDLYDSLKNIINSQNLKEIKINKPRQIWDFTRYIPNFDPKNIKVGDEIRLDGNIDKVLDIISNPNDIHYFKVKGGIYFAQVLIRINNDNKQE